MSEIGYIALALAAGLGLGLVFFGGLWLTLQRLPGTRHPAAFALVSFLGRMIVAMAGIALVSQGVWQRLIACLVGFFALRVLLTRRLRPQGQAGRRRTGDAERGQA